MFTDSSAIVKRYSDEDASAEIRAVTEPVLIAEIARVEVPAALWRNRAAAAEGLATW